MSVRITPGQSAQSSELRKEKLRLTNLAISLVLRRQLRTEDLYQTEVCRSSGVSRTHLQKLLAGEANPSIFVLLELADSLCFADEIDLVRQIVAERNALTPQQGFGEDKNAGESEQR
ncbi:helix-turn-helix domain-containing protein [Steroidobacter agaridevorans]|uniref:helix-turn-helix domain-containing protein n=1 Tax=Steroidobacter agaridevorans TaxID=2695856 RepID=UPI001328C5A4|nr:helix-turn-helix transcriptional regulator [Steroidobacter agaridevorans]GFE85158.1 hypothetical protein GCM10011488_01120 [Steroidobacter agaridevorans]